MISRCYHCAPFAAFFNSGECRNLHRTISCSSTYTKKTENVTDRSQFIILMSHQQGKPANIKINVTVIARS